MGFNGFREFITAVVDNGQTHRGFFRKISASVTTPGVWSDCSTMPIHPITNYYASTPLKAEYLVSKESIHPGSNVSPKQKYLKQITAMCAVAPVNLLMLDYLLYYPFIDGDSTDEQFLDNTNQLTRYTNGRDIRAFVVSQGSYTGGAQFYINYTNQDGVAGRISQTCTSNSIGIYGTLITSGLGAGQFGWSIPLVNGDTGIRSVESFTFLTPNGGIYALVLAKEIGNISVLEANIPSQKDFLTENALNLPEIQDGAYLNFLALANASMAAQPLYGNIQTIWG